jgi:hypothetical protein
LFTALAPFYIRSEIICRQGKPAGQPSIVMPTDAPCDSPKIDTRKSLPNAFIKPEV